MTSSHAKKIAITSGLGAVLLGSACAGMIKSLGDLAKLRQQLIDKYHEQDVRVSLSNSRFLNIVFVNSPLNKQDANKRKNRAQETTRFVVSNYAAIQQVQYVWVTFVKDSTRLIFLHYASMVDGFVFDKNGKNMNAPSSEAEDASKPVARYNATRNETDVSIARLQLEGDLNHGIAMVPHFTLTGNARDPSSSLGQPSPVVVDFASYGDRRLFTGDVKLEIRADDAMIFSGNARLLTPRDSVSESSTAQFLEANIPFAKFWQIGIAQVVKIELGSMRFELSPKEINLLQEMCAYAPPPLPVRKR